ncbi:MAG: hypothetical protein NTV55_05245 [Planctomycetota bacterium]|nr:hypothetical protein [Planctomycetota bacterium]
MAAPLEREEFIEQAYFFRNLRERIAQNLPAQEILQRIDQELLASTRMPMAVQFLAAEMRHSGNLASGFSRLSHYFTPFQAFVVACTENEQLRFPTETALTLLEKEAQYKSGQPTPTGLFVFQFESISRHRLGYDIGLPAMAFDPLYPPDWSQFLNDLRFQVGLIDFADLLFLRSEAYLREQRRTNPDYEPPVPALFGEREGRIAGANRGRDPLYLFAALQRQLGYPEVPRARQEDSLANALAVLKAKSRELETRLKMLEGEVRGNFDFDLLQKLGKPDLLKAPDEVP